MQNKKASIILFILLINLICHINSPAACLGIGRQGLPRGHTFASALVNSPSPENEKSKTVFAILLFFISLLRYLATSLLLLRAPFAFGERFSLLRYFAISLIVLVAGSRIELETSGL